MPQFSQQVNFEALSFDGTAGNATANYSAVTTNSELVAAPGAGKNIYLTSLIVSNGATAGYVTVVENTGSPTTKIQRLNLAANGGCVLSFSAVPLMLSSNVNLGISSSTADDFSVTAVYFVK